MEANLLAGKGVGRPQKKRGPSICHRTLGEEVAGTRTFPRGSPVVVASWPPKSPYPALTQL
ncbi:extracellular invertase [Moniliophthora roreri]|nr:extracellular invertase [Moniliophthora roreri]